MRRQMMWYYMTWYHMIWCDMRWDDMIWYDMIWYDDAWRDMIWCMIWYDMIWCMIWYDMIWFDCDYVWYIVMCDMMTCDMTYILLFWAFLHILVVTLILAVVISISAIGWSESSSQIFSSWCWFSAPSPNHSLHHDLWLWGRQYGVEEQHDRFANFKRSFRLVTHCDTSRYCWWKRSFTSWYGKYFMIYKVSYIPAGAEFLLSTVPLQPTLIASQAGTSAQRRWRPRCLGMLLQTLHTLSRSKWLSDILQKGWRGLDNGRSMSQWISSLSKRDDKRRMLLAVSVHQVRCNFRWRLRDQ